MSDGPHRSLNMPKHWKSLAMQAEMGGFTMDDMLTHIINKHYSQDWEKSIPRDILKRVKTILNNPVLPTFNSQVSEKFELLKKECPGNPHAKLLLEYAICSVQNDEMKSGDLNEIVRNTLNRPFDAFA